MCVCVCAHRPVDVWAVGCLTMEMLTGQPLFPGESDLDQIYQIIRCIGKNANIFIKICLNWHRFNFVGSLTGSLTTHHQELFHRNPVFSGVSLPEYSGRVLLEQRFPKIPNTTLALVRVRFGEVFCCHVFSV